MTTAEIEAAADTILLHLPHRDAPGLQGYGITANALRVILRNRYPRPLIDQALALLLRRRRAWMLHRGDRRRSAWWFANTNDNQCE